MAQIIIDIPDALVTRALNGLAAHYGYRAELDDGTTNPQTRAQYVREKLRKELRTRVLEAEKQVAADIARQTVTEIDITVT